MGINTNDFQENIHEEIEEYTSLTHPRKASLPERLLITTAPVSELHPNPEDEFCDPEIGPSSEIIGEYKESIMAYDYFSKFPHIEPIVVEMLSTGGYRILNGHHRWYAVKELGMKRVPIRIVNTTSENEILSRMKKSDSTMCASFDLDEVLLCPDGSYPTDTLPFPLNRMHTWPIRKDAHLLMNTLRRKGFDVWIYTGHYYPPQYIRIVLKLYGTAADGIVSGINVKKISPKLREAFREKYHTTVHIDNSRLLWVNADTREFMSYDLPSDSTWARRAAGKIQEILRHTGMPDTADFN